MTRGTIAYTEHGQGLQNAITQSGNRIWNENGVWFGDDAAAVQAVISTYDPLPIAKVAAIAAAQLHLAGIVAAGFTYSGVLIAIDAVSSANITSMASVAGDTIAGLVATPWPAGFYWAPQGAGASLPIATPQAMVTFSAAAWHYVSACVLYAEGLATQINAATTVSGVQTINTTTGWPVS